VSVVEEIEAIPPVSSPPAELCFDRQLIVRHPDIPDA
jgi:hypothetical protein